MKTIIEFKKFEHKLKAPFVIYADIESYLKKLDAKEKGNVFSMDCSTEAYQEHIAYAVGYYFHCETDNSKSYYRRSENGTNCVDWFIDELKRIAFDLQGFFLQNIPMEKLSAAQQQAFYDPNLVCHICEKPFEKDEQRVRDHNHANGKFRGFSHSICNLNYQDRREIPVVFHNLSNYDAHLLIRKLATQMGGEIVIIPNNSEQYIAFTKTVEGSMHPKEEDIKFKFVDSFRFLPGSLSELASLIPAEKKRILYAEFGKKYTPDLLQMLERKGVFPYDYIDGIHRLYETTLPTSEQFYNQLNDEHISEADYKFACRVWEKFQIKTLGEYSDLYLKTDVLLLADVFQNFRNICHEIYELEALSYYSAPGLSFSAMLKYTKVKIELVQDPDIIFFLERGIRGGISQSSQKYARANNRYMDDFDPEKKENYLMYLDGNFFIFFHVNLFSPILFLFVSYFLVCFLSLSLLKSKQHVRLQYELKITSRKLSVG